VNLNKTSCNKVELLIVVIDGIIQIYFFPKIVPFYEIMGGKLRISGQATDDDIRVILCKKYAIFMPDN